MSNQHNAPALAPSEQKTATQYSWSTDEEIYRDRCDSIEEAVAAAIDYYGELAVGATVYVGEVLPVTCEQLFSADDVIDLLQNRAYDVGGESAEDYLAVVSDDQRRSLESLIVAWANSVEKPNFWQIGALVKRTVTAEDGGLACEAGQPECGPVEHYDSESVPLCSGCWEALLADSEAANATEVKS